MLHKLGSFLFNISLNRGRAPVRVQSGVTHEQENAAFVENAASFIGGEAGI